MYSLLYVDDEPGLLEIGKLFLEEYGDFSVKTISSATAALDLLEKEKFDVIISDYQMPKIDGIMFLKHLKASGNDTPFIIFTGKGREDVVIEALNEGVTFYLQKGGDPQAQFAELSHKIRAAISHKRTEKHAKDTERRLNDIIEFLPDATFAIDSSGTVIAWNRSMVEMTGISKEDMIGKGDHEYSIPFYGTRRKQLLDLIDFEDKEIEAKYQFVTRKGDSLYAETFTPALYGGKGAYVWATGSPLFDIHGNRVGAIESIRDMTARRHIEEEALLAREEWERTFNAVPDLICILDTQYRIRRMNRSMADKLGVTPEQAVGKPCYQYVHGTQNPPDFCPHAKLLKDQQEHTAEIHEERIEGDFLIRCIPLREKGGQLQGCVHVSRDITERKKAEEALNANTEQYRALLDSAGIGIGYWSYDGILYHMNRKGCENMGQDDPQQVFGKNISELFPAEAASEFYRKRIADMQFSDTVMHYEDEVNLPVGMKWFLSTFSNVIDQQDRKTGVQVLSLDITDRKQSEEALRQSEETFRSFVEESADGIALTDEEDRVIEWNNALERITGICREEVLGKPYIDLTISFLIPEHCTDDRIDRLRAINIEMHRTGKSENFSRPMEVTFMRRDGERRVIQQVLFPIQTIKGFRIGSIVRDITELQTNRSTI
ncbi:MAG: PAS domain S-box protein [Methanomicrobiales archaeon]